MDRINFPPVDNFPDGFIDWNEISDFILNDMSKKPYITIYWNIIDSEKATEKLAENSVLVLKNLRHDLYNFFFHNNIAPDRFSQWCEMEKYIRNKHGNVSENALSQIFSDYRINDR